MMASIREDLAALGVSFDVFTSERALVERGEADRVVERLQADGLVYEGVLEPPKGKMPDDWEPREQTLFRSTQFGDDVDRPLRKSDGSNTYFTNDIANHADKMARGAELMIDVWGADHGGYVSRMKAAVKALAGNTPARLEIVLCQIVHVLRGGQPVRMSKRAGTYVTLADLLEWVGRDAVRFTMLTRKSDAQMEFDLDAVVAQTRENPVFYVQYAHARCRSVLRAAAESYDVSHAALAEVPLDSLGAEAELALIRRLASWPRTVEGAALAQEPHRIAFYLYDLAGDFHMLWNRGRDEFDASIPASGSPGGDPGPAGAGGRDGDRDPLRARRARGNAGRGDALTVSDDISIPQPGPMSPRTSFTHSYRARRAGMDRGTRTPADGRGRARRGAARRHGGLDVLPRGAGDDPGDRGGQPPDPGQAGQSRRHAGDRRQRGRDGRQRRRAAPMRWRRRRKRRRRKPCARRCSRRHPPRLPARPRQRRRRCRRPRRPVQAPAAPAAAARRWPSQLRRRRPRRAPAARWCSSRRWKTSRRRRPSGSGWSSACRNCSATAGW